MGIFDWLFGKKGKGSEVKNVGAVYSALEVPFRPHQCPNCKNYSREIKRCAAFTKPTPPVGELLAMFSGESQEDCVKFEALPKLNLKESIEHDREVQKIEAQTSGRKTLRDDFWKYALLVIITSIVSALATKLILG